MTWTVSVRVLLGIGFGLGVVLAAVLPAAAAPGTRPAARDDELLVKFRPGAAVAAQLAAHQQAGGQVVREVAGLDVRVIKVTAGQAQRRLQAYLNSPDVEYAELNGIAYPDAPPADPPDVVATDPPDVVATDPPDAARTDPLYPRQWFLNNTGQTGGLVGKDIDAPQAWNITTGTSNVAIAIVDTGVRSTHPDLQGKVSASQSWTTATSDPNDYYGHGTHVAGIAAAVTSNGVGVAGVCPGCSLIDAKVCDDNGSCPYDFLANGMLWSVGCDWRRADGSCYGLQHAKVINVSLSGTTPSQTLHDAVNKAWNNGAVLTCAAGNNGTTALSYPAAYTNCIAVAATNNRDQKASWSSYGNAWVDVAAPGVDILSTMIPSGTAISDPSGYGLLSGTSMASPVVAGVAGLLASRGLTRDQLRTRIESTTDAIPGASAYWARGRVNACRALGGTGC